MRVLPYGRGGTRSTRAGAKVGVNPALLVCCGRRLTLYCVVQLFLFFPSPGVEWAH